MIKISPTVCIGMIIILALIYLALIIISSKIKNHGIADNNEKIHSNKYNNQEIAKINQETKTLNEINPITAPALLIYDLCRMVDPLTRYENASKSKQKRTSFTENIKDSILNKFPWLGKN